MEESDRLHSERLFGSGSRHTPGLGADTFTQVCSDNLDATTVCNVQEWAISAAALELLDGVRRFAYARARSSALMSFCNASSCLVV